MNPKPPSARKAHRNAHPKEKAKTTNHAGRMNGSIRFINVPEPFRTVLFVGGMVLLLSVFRYWASGNASVGPSPPVITPQVVQQVSTFQPGQKVSHPVVAASGQLVQTDHTGKPAFVVTGNAALKLTALQNARVSYTYTSSGLRATMTDASGTTLYSYDARNNLLSKQTPQGTLTYTYDGNGNVLTIRSSNVNGISLDYGYDAVSRLVSVKDNRLPAGANTTTYIYDNTGNLSTTTLPNGTVCKHTYDALDRLTHLKTTQETTVLADFSYTLAPAGHRLTVQEPGGRTTTYTYNDIYLLQNETITGASPPHNGSVAYTYDAVGNRLTQTSTLAAIPSASFGYTPNDWLTSDAYDNNGNTLMSGGLSYVYDFENRLVGVVGAPSLITCTYDGDGNQVAKTIGESTTRYLVDDNNPTGYAQVAEELENSAVVRQYSYGLELISQRQTVAGSPAVHFYGYDGHGSIRFLTDSTGIKTDSYDYDAFGVTTAQSGTTPNLFRYAGQQFDPDLGFYYNRARYLNVKTDRFLTMDAWEGEPEVPQSQHKYLYASGDPVNRIDPSGESDFNLSSTNVTLGARGSLANTGGNAALRINQVTTQVIQRLQHGVIQANRAVSTATNTFGGQVLRCSNNPCVESLPRYAI